MLKLNRNQMNRLIILIVIFFLPLIGQAQSRSTDARALHREIDKLSKKLSELKSEQNRIRDIDLEIDAPRVDTSKRDSLRVIVLKKRQTESRARIEELTNEVIRISNLLKDPDKRYAMAKKIQHPKVQQQEVSDNTVQDTTAIPEVISARSIDLFAVKLVRQGNTLDQARLLTIDELLDGQVQQFYRNLPKDARYELYDIADEIVATEKVDLVDARRSAIYFYLFTK